MAREGLRTLVVAKKPLSQEQFVEFERRYSEAKLSINDRATQVLCLKDAKIYTCFFFIKIKFQKIYNVISSNKLKK